MFAELPGAGRNSRAQGDQNTAPRRWHPSL